VVSHDRVLAERLRGVLAGEAGVSEKRMFGGVAFLVRGRLAVSASGTGGLMVRVDPSESAALVAQDGVAPFVMRGRDMAGWVRVEADAVADDEDLRGWVDRGLAYASSLPPA